jgi:excinuclease UvrABC nuclease subunit
MIKIEIPPPDIVITKSNMKGDKSKPPMCSVYGFIDYEKIPRNVPGIYMFYNQQGELLYCGQTKKGLRNRIKDHFYSDNSAVSYHRDEIYKIAVNFVPDALERELYETFIINELRSKYNVDKVLFK